MGRRVYNRRLSTQPSLDAPAGHRPAPDGQRLESWKEIAAYLNRSERTVRRWEDREGLPVHRLQHDKRGSVYAYAAELDAWRESRRQLVDAEPADSPAMAPGATTGWRTRGWAAAALLAVVVVAAAVWWTQRPPAGRAEPNSEAVRLVGLANFSGNAGRMQIQTGIRYLQEAIRLDPSYALAWSGLATAHVAETWFGDRAATETMAAAKREAEEALRLDPANSGAWRSLAWVAHLDWDHRTA